MSDLLYNMYKYSYKMDKYFADGNQHRFDKYNYRMAEIKTYKVLINNDTIIELTTPDIEWSMEQYQRNRLPFKYKILESYL